MEKCPRCASLNEDTGEISLVTYRHFIKQNLLGALKDEILKKVPSELLTNKKKAVVDISA